MTDNATADMLADLMVEVNELLMYLWAASGNRLEGDTVNSVLKELYTVDDAPEEAIEAMLRYTMRAMTETKLWRVRDGKWFPGQANLSILLKGEKGNE